MKIDNEVSAPTPDSRSLQTPLPLCVALITLIHILHIVQWVTLVNRVKLGIAHKSLLSISPC